MSPVSLCLPIRAVHDLMRALYVKMATGWLALRHPLRKMMHIVTNLSAHASQVGLTLLSCPLRARPNEGALYASGHSLVSVAPFAQWDDAHCNKYFSTWILHWLVESPFTFLSTPCTTVWGRSYANSCSLVSVVPYALISGSYSPIRIRVNFRFLECENN